MNSLLLKSVTQAWLLSELIFQVGFWSCCFRTQLLLFSFHVRIVGVFVCYCCLHFISWILGADELAARPYYKYLFLHFFFISKFHLLICSFIWITCVVIYSFRSLRMRMNLFIYSYFIYVFSWCTYLFIYFSSIFVYWFIFFFCL